MILEHSESFEKSVKRIKDVIALKRLKVLIEALKAAHNLNEIPNVKPVVKNPNVYRIRTGNYRLFVLYKNFEITILLLEYVKKNEKIYDKYNE